MTTPEKKELLRLLKLAKREIKAKHQEDHFWHIALSQSIGAVKGGIHPKDLKPADCVCGCMTIIRPVDDQFYVFCTTCRRSGFPAKSKDAAVRSWAKTVKTLASPLTQAPWPDDARREGMKRILDEAKAK